MKSFYGVTFMDRESLKKEGIYYPIKLEYYKMEDEQSGVFGVEVIKTEYKQEKIEPENIIVSLITDNEKLANKIIDKLKEGQVSTNTVEDVVEELMKENGLKVLQNWEL